MLLLCDYTKAGDPCDGMDGCSCGPSFRHGLMKGRQDVEGSFLICIVGKTGEPEVSRPGENESRKLHVREFGN